MSKVNNIVSLSGGKDSTALLLMMLERNEPIHSVVWCDTGWEFPAMHDHINLLEQQVGMKIWRLKPRMSFNYWMFEHHVKSRANNKINRIGYGWPSPLRRWCTREKARALTRFCKLIKNPIFCIGYASDESRGTPDTKIQKRFPLQEWEITEKDCLEYCYSKGYHWDGLYEHFRRVSCFCCPLQRLRELQILRKEYPELWQKILNMDTAIKNNTGFKNYKTAHDLENRFACEDKQLKLF